MVCTTHKYRCKQFETILFFHIHLVCETLETGLLNMVVTIHIYFKITIIFLFFYSKEQFFIFYLVPRILLHSLWTFICCLLDRIYLYRYIEMYNKNHAYADFSPLFLTESFSYPPSSPLSIEKTTCSVCTSIHYV